MKKLRHEAELVKEAIRVGMRYAEARGAARFEATDSASDKLLYIYRLLVQQSLRHKLAIWYSKQLPQDHPLLKD